MKVLKIIKSIILGILGITFFVFALIITILVLNFNKYNVTQFGETSLIIINTKISSENYKKGDLVVVEMPDISDIKIGDEIFTYKLLTDKTVGLEVGKVGKINLETGEISLVNGNTFTDEFIAGKGVKVYNDIGLYLSIIESKWGFLFTILVPSFLIFIWELYALIIEIKYGSEEN